LHYVQSFGEKDWDIRLDILFISCIILSFFRDKILLINALKGIKKFYLMKKILYFLFASVIFVSCGKDEPVEVPGLYDKGVFVVNEGPFGSGTGTLTFLGDNNEVTQKVYEKANNNLLIGNVAQSMIYHNDRYYIVVNNANKVIVTDKDLKAIGEITGITGPRYIVAKGDKAYISEWGSNYSNGAVAVVDLNTLKVTKTIPTGNGPEYLLIDGNQLYVPNGGAYDATTFANLPDSTVSVIDLNSESVAKTIPVKYNPNSIAKYQDGYLVSSAEKEYLDGNGKIYFIHGSEYSAVETSGTTAGSYGKIRRIDDTKAVVIANFSEANIISYNTSTRTITSSSLGTAYATDFDSKRNRIYVADAKDFSSTGEVKTFTVDGKVDKSFETGIIPTNFCFR
jgi:YVTN family beta-propeller protein